MADTLDELINAAWADHEHDPTAVALRLEGGVGLVTDLAAAARLARLAAHAIGDELADWPRAARLIAAVSDRPGSHEDRARVLAELALARLLAGDSIGALATEMAAMAAHAPAATETLLRVRLLAAESCIGSGRFADGNNLYRAALELAGAVPAPGAERSLAISSNNIASALLERDDRDAEADELMELSARAARRYWLLAGDWTHDERSNYLLALVANARGRFGEAEGHVREALATISSHGTDPVDEAFLHVAHACALRGLGNAAACEEAIARAGALRPAVEAAGARDWFERELGRLL